MSNTRIQQALTSLRRLDRQIARCFEYKPFEWYSPCYNGSYRSSRLPQLKEAFDGGVIAASFFALPIGIIGECLGCKLYPLTIFVVCITAATCDGVREVIAEEIKKEERLKPPEKSTFTHVMKYSFEAGKAWLKTPKAFIDYPLTMLTSCPPPPCIERDNWVVSGITNGARAGFYSTALFVALLDLISNEQPSGKVYLSLLCLSVVMGIPFGAAHGLTNYVMHAVTVVDQKRKQHDQTFPSKCAARLFALPGQVARYARDTVVQFPGRRAKAMAKENSNFYFQYYAFMGGCLGALAGELSWIVKRPVDDWSLLQRLFVGALLGIPLSQLVAVRDMADDRGLYQLFEKKERARARLR